MDMAAKARRRIFVLCCCKLNFSSSQTLIHMNFLSETFVIINESGVMWALFSAMITSPWHQLHVVKCYYLIEFYAPLSFHVVRFNVLSFAALKNNKKSLKAFEFQVWHFEYDIMQRNIKIKFILQRKCE